MFERPPATIVFVNAGAERGGAEVVLLTLLRHLDRRRFAPEACLLADGPLAEEIRRLDVPIVIEPAPGFRRLRQGAALVGRLRQLISARRAEVVHANGTGAHLYGGLAARRAGIPNVFHVHDVLAPTWDRQGLVTRAASCVPAAAVVTPSRFLAVGLRGRVRRRTPVLTIPNGLDDAPVSATLPAAPDATGPLAVWCGRLQRWKGAHVFLEAAALAHRAVPSARFLVVGGTLFGLETTVGDDLRHQAAALGIGGCVEFTGHVADARPFLARADVVVHSAVRPEPFGLVVLEAMLAGRPVVASAAGGPLELIEDGATGLLTPPGDAAALADALVGLFRDPAGREAMGRAARARAVERHSADAMTRRFERLYADLAVMTLPGSFAVAR